VRARRSASLIYILPRHQTVHRVYVVVIVELFAQQMLLTRNFHLLRLLRNIVTVE